MGNVDASACTLPHRLQSGWRAAHADSVRDLLKRIGHQLGAHIHVTRVGENTLTFTADLSAIRLRGTHQVDGLLVAGDVPDLGKAARAFWQRSKAPGSLALLIALNDRVHQQALELLPRDSGIALTANQVEELLDSHFPLDIIRTQMIEHLPKRRLMPYNIAHPAIGGMFFGRRTELDRLLCEDERSFAVAGPSRIGKTSLVKQYLWEQSRRREAMDRHRYISFYEYDGTDENAIARHLAMQIRATNLSNHITRSDLATFLKRNSIMMGGMLDLVLDEVDAVCRSETFKVIAQAARDKYCRLVLCGRGELMKLALDAASPLSCRLGWIRLEPLDITSATRLLCEPLSELGVAIQDPTNLFERVFHLTGGMPHLIQYYGSRLAEQSIDEERSEIGIHDVETIRWEYETVQYFLSPLHDLEGRDIRRVARLLLLASGKHPTVRFTVRAVVELAERDGCQLTEKEALDICNELVICNILIWSHEGYRLANQALPEYVRRTGLWTKG